MRGFVAIVRRELLAYFYSPLAYIIMTTFLFVFGFLFDRTVTILSNPRYPPADIFPLLLNNPFTWIILFLYCSTLTMRLIAEDRRSGAVETLMTSPVTEWGVVIGKFLGALLFYAVLWAPTLVYVWVIAMFARVDFGPIASGYLGIMLIGAFFLSIGIFASSLTKNQVVAAIIGFSILLVVFLFGILGAFATDPVWKNIWSYLTLWDHMEDFGKGIVDTRRLAYYVSGTVFFLYLTGLSLEVRKWR